MVESKPCMAFGLFEVGSRQIGQIVSSDIATFQVNPCRNERLSVSQRNPWSFVVNEQHCSLIQSISCREINRCLSADKERMDILISEKSSVESFGFDGVVLIKECVEEVVRVPVVAHPTQ